MNRRKLSWFDRCVAIEEADPEIVVLETTKAQIIKAIGGKLRAMRWLKKRGYRKAPGRRPGFWHIEICRWRLWPDEIENISKAVFSKYNGTHRSPTALDRKETPILSYFQFNNRKSHGRP